MTDELDWKVSEKVLGRTTDYRPGVAGSLARVHMCMESLGDGTCRPIRHYTTDPRDDYEVLKHVREKWDENQQRAFQRCLLETMSKRGWCSITTGYAWLYEPGDYSRAALLAIGEKVV